MPPGLFAFLTDQLQGDDVTAAKLTHLPFEIEGVTAEALTLLWLRFAEVHRVLTEVFFPLALKLGRRDLAGHTFLGLCTQLEVALGSPTTWPVAQALTANEAAPAP